MRTPSVDAQTTPSGVDHHFHDLATFDGANVAADRPLAARVKFPLTTSGAIGPVAQWAGSVVKSDAIALAGYAEELVAVARWARAKVPLDPAPYDIATTIEADAVDRRTILRLSSTE